MYRTISTIVITIAVFLASPTFADEGWKTLFDGKSLEGWSVKSGYATYAIEEGGVIVGKTAEGSRNTFLCTEEEYGDFELTFEVNVDTGLNSGVQIRSKLKPEPASDPYGGRVYGPQVEIESSPGQSGWIYGEATGRGWISPEPQSKDKSVNEHKHVRNDDWNQFRVIAKGANIKTFINGHPVADLTDEEIYQSHPRGFIGLQVHGIRGDSGPFEVRWRNLKIQPL